jgi:hypothetical protein
LIRIPRHDPDIPEAMLQKIVIAHLATIPGCRIWRMSVGAAMTIDPRTRTMRKLTFGVPGQADLSGLLEPTGRRLEIELKTPTGRQTPEQRIWQAEIERYGGLYVLARSLEQAMVPVCVALGLAYEIA